MAAPVCQEGNCGAVATHHEIATKMPLCAQHVAVQVSMVDAEYSARDGWAIFGRFAELLWAMSRASITSQAAEAVKDKLRHTSAQIGVWILTKIPNFQLISVPDQQTLSVNVEAAAYRIVEAAGALAAARQTTREPQARAAFERASNDLWSLIYTTAQRARPSRLPMFQSAKLTYDQMVRDQSNMIAGTMEDDARPIQASRLAGESLDTAFAV